jgi:transposase
VQELSELQRQGMSIQGISKLTGWDRKTVRKYLLQPNALPAYRPRRKQASKLDPFKPYLKGRMRAGVWNAQVLLRELRERNYTGEYTILKDWLHPQRMMAEVALDQKDRLAADARRSVSADGWCSRSEFSTTG